MRKMLSVPLRKTLQVKIEAIILRGWLRAFTKINLAVQSLKKTVLASNKQLTEAGI
jgi:hypothetical protein